MLSNVQKAAATKIKFTILNFLDYRQEKVVKKKSISAVALSTIHLVLEVKY